VDRERRLAVLAIRLVEVGLLGSGRAVGRAHRGWVARGKRFLAGLIEQFLAMFFVFPTAFGILIREALIVVGAVSVHKGSDAPTAIRDQLFPEWPSRD
jgi:hypothetical protein